MYSALESFNWRNRLYQAYVSSGQGGSDALSEYRSTSPYLNRVISNHVPKELNSVILDVGCGSGGMLHCLKKRGYKTLRGVDLSKEMVALAHKNGMFEVKQGDLHTTLSTIPEHSIDVCFVMDILEHLDRGELLHVCDSIFRVLKRGGRIIAHVPNAGGIFGAIIRFGDLTHENAFTEASINQALRTVGFTAVRCYEDKPVPHGLKSFARRILWEVGTSPFRLLYACESGSFHCILSQNLLAVARKPPI